MLACFLHLASRLAPVTWISNREFYRPIGGIVSDVNIKIKQPRAFLAALLHARREYGTKNLRERENKKEKAERQKEKECSETRAVIISIFI